MSQVKESLSIEETNKIRISLGLKPLPTPDSNPAAEPELDPDQKAELNYANHRQAEQQAIESNRVKERVLKAKDTRERLAKLSGRGLGELEPDQGVDDLKKWVKQHKKKQSKKFDPLLAAKKKEQELNADEAEYGTHDLQGLKVGHDLKDLESSLMDQEMVLTLKDSRILDGEDDELENVELAEHTRTKEAVELKRKGTQAGQYTGYDDDEFLAPGQSQKVLAKYSDTIDGKQEKSFKLGDHIQLNQDSLMNDPEQKEIGTGLKITKKQTAEILKKDLINLEYSKTIGSDYMQEGEAEFKKKTKKKKSKKARQRAPTSTVVGGDEEEQAEKNGSNDAMEVDEIQKTVQSTEPDVIDDEEVQAAMSRMRREAGKLRRKKQQQQEPMTQKEDQAIKSESDQEMSLPTQSIGVEVDDEDDGRLVIDDASEFIRTISLQQERLAEMRKKEQETKSKLRNVVSIEPSLSAIPESESAESPVDEEAERRVMERLMAGDETLTRSENDEVGEVKEAQDPEAYGTTGAEKYVLGGMAATLSLLKSQGLIKPLTQEEREKERLYKDKVAWLIEQRRREALREAEKERTKKMGDAKDQATREYENRMREAAMAKEAMEAYRHYKPDVEIKYNDEFGRELTQKEAWKALSHKFHGKGSGKAKTEKRIKKIEEEKKLAAMASGDTPTGTNEAFRKRQEKLASATMVLSVGNKGSAPHQEEFLSSLSKPAGSSKKAKGTNANNKGVNNRVVQKHTISAGPDLMNGLGSQINSGMAFSMDGFNTPSGLMAPRKAGFKPIANSSQSSSLNPNSKSSSQSSSMSHSIMSSNSNLNHSTNNLKSNKISIGLAGNKRKADEMPSGGPDPKRPS